MRPTLVAIVEGQGEVRAVPVLIRRIAALHGHHDITIPTPIRCPRSKIIRPHGVLEKVEFSRAIQLAINKLPSRECGAILVLFDADDECPASLGPGLLELAQNVRDDVQIHVVIAKREYEAWFLAAAESLKQAGKLTDDAVAPNDAESLADPKRKLAEWLRSPQAYSEPIDQPSLTQLFDLDEAQACDSFAKLRREVRGILSHLYPNGGTPVHE